MTNLFDLPFEDDPGDHDVAEEPERPVRIVAENPSPPRPLSPERDGERGISRGGGPAGPRSSPSVSREPQTRNVAASGSIEPQARNVPPAPADPFARNAVSSTATEPPGRSVPAAAAEPLARNAVPAAAVEPQARNVPPAPADPLVRNAVS